MTKKVPPRTIIESISPSYSFPLKRLQNDIVSVVAQVFADGHDKLRVQLLHRFSKEHRWSVTEMAQTENDNWAAQFKVSELGIYEYKVRAWTDEFLTWHAGTRKKADAGLDISLEIKEGHELLNRTSERSGQTFKFSDEELLSEQILSIVAPYPNLKLAAVSKQSFEVEVDRALAGFSSWYEIFPRSFGGLTGLISELPRIRALGFDVIYLPPIHPIGVTHRKGKNNSLTCEPEDTGSPWAIGGAEGGHKEIHPELGNENSFFELVSRCNKLGMEIALDIAFQCSPDHPWVKQHPSWFKKRPDGSIQYAENPPKKYQDIYPLDFESEDWEELWNELLEVFLHWADRGVLIFRVDNPHTKAFSFWKWVIREVKIRYPNAIFLSEAFSRPAIKYHLAKIGFTQSYTYFTWKNTKTELTDYLTSLYKTNVSDYCRPNFFANTPDILHEYLQVGGRKAHKVRLILAATLSSNYGIYGPAFELCENKALKQRSEEYLDSEKYQTREWNFKTDNNISELISKVNDIRKSSIDFQTNLNIEFLEVNNEHIFAVRKGNHLIIVNLDTTSQQSGWLEVPGMEESYTVTDLLTDSVYNWSPGSNFVLLTPDSCPAHILRIKQ